MDGQTDGWMERSVQGVGDGWTEGGYRWMDGPLDGKMDGQMDRWTDKDGQKGGRILCGGWWEKVWMD